MFGSDIIRVKIKGFLKNVTEDCIMDFDENGIRNKHSISFKKDDVKYNIKLLNNAIIMVRETDDYINSFVFKKKNATSNYLLKDNNYSLDVNIDVQELNINDNYFYVRYVIMDTSCTYDFKIEMSNCL